MKHNLWHKQAIQIRLLWISVKFWVGVQTYVSKKLLFLFSHVKQTRVCLFVCFTAILLSLKIKKIKLQVSELLNEFGSFTDVSRKTYRRKPKRTLRKTENECKYSDCQPLARQDLCGFCFIHLVTQVGRHTYKPQRESESVVLATVLGASCRRIHLLLLPFQHVGPNLSLAELLRSVPVQQQRGRLLLRPLGLGFFQGPSNLRVSDTRAQVLAKPSVKGKPTRDSFSLLAWCRWLTGGAWIKTTTEMWPVLPV